jgi:Ras-related protein Rab-8A
MSAKPQIIRLLTLGDSGAGKSSLLLRYTQNEFNVEYMPTIGIDFRLKTVEVKGKTVKVQVWDTAGQERFRTITHNYYRGAHGIALVYDITSKASFDNIRKWIADVQSYAESHVNIVLIGNKCDLQDQRVIDTEQGRAVAKEYDIDFYEASAKTDLNVREAFDGLVNQVCERVIAGNGKKTTKVTSGAGGSTAGSGEKRDSKSVDIAGGGGGEKKKCC